MLESTQIQNFPFLTSINRLLGIWARIFRPIHPISIRVYPSKWRRNGDHTLRCEFVQCLGSPSALHSAAEGYAIGFCGPGVRAPNCTSHSLSLQISRSSAVGRESCPKVYPGSCKNSVLRPAPQRIFWVIRPCGSSRSKSSQNWCIDSVGDFDVVISWSSSFSVELLLQKLEESDRAVVRLVTNDFWLRFAASFERYIMNILQSILKFLLSC